MKKLISIVAASLLSVGAFANTATVTVPPAGFTLLSAGAMKVTQIITTGTTSTNSAALLVDTANSNLTYVTLAYTNYISYLTNQPVKYTNYWGVLSTNADNGGTNWVLVDVQQNIAQATNNLPTVTVGVIGNQTLTYGNLSTYFFRGICVTNTGSGAESVTITYIPQ